MLNNLLLCYYLCFVDLVVATEYVHALVYHANAAQTERCGLQVHVYCSTWSHLVRHKTQLHLIKYENKEKFTINITAIKLLLEPSFLSYSSHEKWPGQDNVLCGFHGQSGRDGDSRSKGSHALMTGGENKNVSWAHRGHQTIKLRFFEMYIIRISNFNL